MPNKVPLAKLAKPAQRAIQAAGIQTLQELSQHREADIAALHGIGKHALKILRDALREVSLSYADEL